MKTLIFLVLILTTACWAKEDAPAPSSSARPKGFRVDPDAVALFDRAAKFYSGCKTIRMRWITPQKPIFGDNDPIIVTIAFARPNRIKVLCDRGKYMRMLDLADGKFSWSMQYDGLPPEETFGATYSKEPLAQGKGALKDTVKYLISALGPGDVLSEWLRGEHELQPARIKAMRAPKQNVEYLEARKLAPASWKGRSWERVQINYRYGPHDGWPALSYAEIFWLSPDNARLVKMEELNIKGEVSETQEIVEQTFNAAIPASTFVFKIPKGAKKE